ncbi:hypothetical protein PVAP13_6KG040500 [Panicum virgatum]|uniref:BED-type domain-containing protein n=1 Tax=Panicum virgatum TaxID=38727 RepID=A0A8T0R8R7_PANVG|nr:hypothetical protein PVAP13_6KG040500 [Panicum virgatum]
MASANHPCKFPARQARRMASPCWARRRHREAQVCGRGGTFSCATPHGTNGAEQVDGSRDNYRLQHQVEGGMIAWDNQHQGTGVNGGAQLVDGTRDNSGIPNRNDRKKRSKAWEEFSITEEDADGKPVRAECIHCGTQVRCETTKGTSVLHNHLKSENCKRKRASIEQTPNPLSADDGAQNGAAISTHDSDRRKRMRSDEILAHNIAANTILWDKAEICNRIQQTTHQLQKAISEVQSGYIASSTNLCQNTVADSCRRTSSLMQHKMYGRIDEKNSIIKHMTVDNPDSVIVLPIVGIGGIGKTALAQVIYNDLIAKNEFDNRIWIWVSSNLDEVKLTMEMLDFVAQEKCVGTTNLSRLQEILMTYVTSKRTLLIMDDVWDDIDDFQWNKLLAPLRTDNAKGNVVIVTTRKLSVAKRIGTVEHINLGPLQNDNFWLFFKACAFGDETCKEHPSLTIIGQKIANNLQGNPLAAQTAGMLLREHLTTDHWSNILKNEKWKSLQLNGGIMHALKLSYDELPYHLQQCFLYCSIFPNNHQFLSNELVCIWISQGFVKCSHSTERLEEIGHNYLTDLLNAGFFEQVETKDPILGNKTLYFMPPLMHDFARLVSRTECAAIDDLACRVVPNVRHLSILTSSAYHEDQHGNIPRNEKFEGKLRRVVESTKKLRTLVLIGTYDYFLFRSLKGIFQKAQNLRMLHISASYAGFGHSLCNLINNTHFRYLKLRTKEDNQALPEALTKSYHLQVLDIDLHGCSTVSNGMNNLISLRHLVASKAVYSSIRNIGKMTSLLELHDFNCTSLEIAQLQSLSELAQLGVSQLENVVTREEAYGAKLREKSHLEKLHLSWKYTLPDIMSCEPLSGYIHDIMSSEPSFDAVETQTSKEVLEGLEPHPNLKHLQISGYRSGTSPDWLVRTVSVTCLQTLHLEDCRELQVLPSLERLPLLTKLKLRNMWKVRQVTLPSLEELVLIKMPKLERCSCNSVRDLTSSLRVLTIEECRVLEVFPLFESCEKLIMEQKSWLSNLSVLTIHDCPQLIVSNPLPPSSSTRELSISRVSTLPTMEASSNAELIIGMAKVPMPYPCSDEDSNELTKLDDKILSFHNLRGLTRLKIRGCQNLSCISLRGLRQLINLKSLEINFCKGLFASDVLPEHAGEDMADAGSIALPSLEHLEIGSCGITGKWLSMMLQHATALEKLYLRHCDRISGLLIEGKGGSLSNHTCTTQASLAGNPDDTLTSSTPEGLLRIPSNLVSSLKEIMITWCNDLTFNGNREGFSGFTSLEKLKIFKCPKLIPSFMQKYENNDQGNGRWLLPHSLRILEISHTPETLQPCFLEDRNCLRELDICSSHSLKILQLYSCTALEELTVANCIALIALEGNFTCLRKLQLEENPRLKSLQLRSCTALEELKILTCESLATLAGNLTCLKKLVLQDSSVLESPQLYSCTALEELTVQHCKAFIALEGNFTCLRKLQLEWNPRLKSLQLRFCTALEQLVICCCESLDTLEGFRSLRGLRYLKVYMCPGLPHMENLLSQGYERCAGLERLRTDDFSFLTTSLCKCLTSLQHLEFGIPGGVRRLTDEQERALQLLTSLQELRFWSSYNLADLPEGLQNLPSLKKLEIIHCNRISRLPEMGLPPSLEELAIYSCSKELTDACGTLATASSKPKVKIDGKYVN